MTDDEIHDSAAASQGETWRRWFAWRPVLLTEGEPRWVWREWIERRDFELGWGVSHHQKRALPPPAREGGSV